MELDLLPVWDIAISSTPADVEGGTNVFAYTMRSRQLVHLLPIQGANRVHEQGFLQHISRFRQHSVSLSARLAATIACIKIRGTHCGSYHL
jgi:hypothetical protein